jgi:hypothetical protein
MTTFALYSRTHIVGILCIPVIASLLSNYVNRILLQDTDDILVKLLLKGCLDYISLIVQQSIIFKQSNDMYEALKMRLNLAKIYCGIPIPGVNQGQFKDLTDEASKC